MDKIKIDLDLCKKIVMQTVINYLNRGIADTYVVKTVTNLVGKKLVIDDGLMTVITVL